MKIAVFGTGMVGRTVGGKLVELGHEVKMGSRTADNANAAEWAAAHGDRATHGTYADAAAFGEIAFNCTAGAGSMEALRLAGAANLNGKILVDISNPLDFSKGMPPSLFISNTDSLGEEIQRTFPDVKVVKTLNTVNCDVMVDPARLGGPSAVFVSGNDADAKSQVSQILTEGFGWQQIVDLGDITTARGTEAYLLLWIRMWGALQTADFNVRIVKPQ